MEIDIFFDILESLDDTKLFEGARATDFVNLIRICGVNLPRLHKEILCYSNGIESFGGYYRIYGIEGTQSVNSLIWNTWEHWKFAWSDRCVDYWCFGGNAWGDQYAYRVENSKLSLNVFLLDAFSMEAEDLGMNFEDFIERKFIRYAIDPPDSMTLRAREKEGDLDSGESVTYIPPLLFGGTEIVENIHRIDARLAMIFNGDIALGVDGGPVDRLPIEVKPYRDDLGRDRLELIW